ncbi:hypothetical protein DM860_003071 [Cuscuta australis]|uniref:Uncharacterized protein n=1 Tax=Cuscuta australis TaxID=267555 RepID=A0A328D511_9ASTE|nr:hypothetical protein DM860_003071 [Cuscuta australis]
MLAEVSLHLSRTAAYLIRRQRSRLDAIKVQSLNSDQEDEADDRELTWLNCAGKWKQHSGIAINYKTPEIQLQDAAKSVMKWRDIERERERDNGDRSLPFPSALYFSFWFTSFFLSFICLLFSLVVTVRYPPCLFNFNHDRANKKKVYSKLYNKEMH